ncbi:sensor histidine kinase [Propionispora hippei]|uniref:histidine kinase n=1 Tax=Propionispora hippei DSM 15287 TaxID=1123003 RepID=A0A1M6EJL6_9FIRM|nr:sensor histidine kinase [Propionispora hippei]SHI85651.1 Two-component sensor histidine kinase, contains HisKA and HATPase domains [Propionispora hippei DSM 15287]
MVKITGLLRELCLEYTYLTEPDIVILENIAGQLDITAELTGTDVFIDALCRNSSDSIVLAWAHSSANRSLYNRSVVGQLAYAEKEPAVYKALTGGQIMRDIRGISQEGVPIAQTVVPVTNLAKHVIGVLIMEKDISEEIRQEEQVQFLSQTAEHLSRTLMDFTTTGWGWEEWLGSGIFVLDQAGAITYTNKHAERMLEVLCGAGELKENLITALSYGSLEELVEGLKKAVNLEFGHVSYLCQAHPLVTDGELSGCVVSVQDVTELRQKEKELDVKSAVIQEIHHRVKNTLQNVVSLLRLQMNRSRSETVQSEFATCVNRILSISRVHEVLARQSWETVDLKELAEYIVSNIVAGYSLAEQEIVTQVEGASIMIPAQQSVPVALVLNELVTNSLKHGIKTETDGEIRVSIWETAGCITIQVIDSGAETVLKQLPAGNKLGLYIVQLLICDQLGGSFSLSRQHGSTVATISFLSGGKEQTV